MCRPQAPGTIQAISRNTSPIVTDFASRRALITGVTGQDGSFLAELLLGKGYQVAGLVRGDHDRQLGCSEHLRDQLQLVHGDLLAPRAVRDAIEEVRPNEVYHLAAPSFVPASWRCLEQTSRAIIGATTAMLEAVRDIDPQIRVYASASGAMFGNAPESPQRESTPCRPTNPYAIAKLAAHQLVGSIRTHDRLFACSGIVFNHESERRPEHFVTRKITRGAAAIKLGLQNELVLGDLDAVRDWSFAGDVMEGAWLTLQQQHPQDYVLASGIGHTVAELAQTAFTYLDLDAEAHVRIDPALIRPKETALSVGDPTRAREVLRWCPRVDFEELVERMVRADLQDLQQVAK